MLTIHDLLRLRSLAVTGERLYGWGFNAYRVLRMALNPAGAVMREVADLNNAQWKESGLRELKQWGLDFVVRQVGFYAVEMYSGRLVLDPDAVARRREADAEKVTFWSRDADPRDDLARRQPTVQGPATMRAGIARHLSDQQALADRIYTRWLALAAAR